MHARSTFKEKVRDLSLRTTTTPYLPRTTPPTPTTNRVIVWFVFMYFVLLSVSVMFHSVLSDPCFGSVCQAMRM